jgi:GTP-binding protein
LKNAEDRGILFIGAGVEVYEGMVVGKHQRPGDLVVNVCKKRHVTNVRSSRRASIFTKGLWSDKITWLNRIDFGH